MDDSFGGGFTQTGGDSTKTESKAEGTLPVFIRHIKKQEDSDTFTFFGQEYKMVTIVAVVRNIEHSSTKITYELEDMSGRIMAHLWVDEDAPSNQNIIINSYVRVVGGVRSQNKQKTIMIYKIHPVSGINEVNTHLIEVVNVRYAAEENAGGKAKGDMKMDVDSASGSVVGNGAGGDQHNDDTDGLNAKEKVIFNLIRSALESDNVEGFHRDEICKRFPHFSRGEIDAMLLKMSTEGLIYTTIDTDHFQACF